MSAESPKRVVVIGGGLSAKHCVEILAKKKNRQVTLIQANKFVEWPIAMPLVLSRPDTHDKALAVNSEDFQVPGVTYRYGVATGVDTSEKCVRMKDGTTEQYDALVLATGFKMPLIYPEVGTTVEERKAEVQAVGGAIRDARCVVVGGGGIVGVEVATNIRTAYPGKEVRLHSRGQLLSTFPERTQKKVAEVLKGMNIEVVTGKSLDAPEVVKTEAGKFTVGEQELQYDVYLPAYSRGPNTGLLASNDGMLDEQGRIKVNGNLQAEAFPEVFAVGTSNVAEPFIGIAKLEGQWKTVAGNVECFLSGKQLSQHKENMPFMKYPPLLLLGDGKGAWGSLDFSVVPAPLKCCCCCGYGGFPFCPPPCCWVVCSPCCCGYCGGAPEGPSVANGFKSFGFKTFGFHFKGGGKAAVAPKQEAMS